MSSYLNTTPSSLYFSWLSWFYPEYISKGDTTSNQGKTPKTESIPFPPRLLLKQEACPLSNKSGTFEILETSPLPIILKPAAARNIPEKFENSPKDTPSSFFSISVEEIDSKLKNLKKVLVPEPKTQFESRNPVVNELNKYFKEHNLNF